jgi:hypothetical protein
MALTKKRCVKSGIAGGYPDAWQNYVDLVACQTDQPDDARMLVPLFPCSDFVPGNVLTISARAARALAGIGTPEEVARVRACMLDNRAKACH